MKVLVTGGAGFLGYHLVHYLNSHGAAIVLSDIAPFVKEEYPQAAIFHNVDVRDQEGIERITKDVDFVVHAAAALPLWSRPDILTTNVDGTRNVLEAARRRGARRVVFISSTAVYGVPEKHPIVETDPRIGVGPYGESKIAAEGICFDYIKKGLNVTIIRPKTFLGPGRLGVFQILYDWVESGRRIPILGDGRNRYQLLAVEDLTEVIDKILSSNVTGLNDVFNVGAEQFGTVAADVGALCDFAGSGARILPVPAGPVKIALRTLETLRLSPLYRWVYETADKDSFVSIEKAKAVLGFHPKFSNAQTLINSYRWYLEHLDEIKGQSGITHRVAWKQGALGLFKRML